LKPARRNSPAFLFLLIAFFFSACSKEKIPEEILVKVYVESVIINESYTFNSDSLRIKKQMVFKKYGVTEKQFETELKEYSQDKGSWERFFKKANDYLNDLKKNGTIN
jgi:hypothetical protein